MSATEPRPRPDPPAPLARVAALPRYTAGRTAEAAAADHGLASAVKLASNESPFGPLPGVAEAVAAAVSGSNRYADPASAAVTRRFAEAVGVDAERVVAGPGSVGLLEQLTLAFVDADDEVLYPWPSFVAYPQFTQLVAGRRVEVALRRQTLDVDAVLAAVTETTRLVIVANPNNPTSTALPAAELDRLVAGVPPTCLVVVDEAYREYVTDPGVADSIVRYADHPNVAVLRTLSKAYGLAGLRIGFLVGDPAVVDAVGACMIPFAVNAAVQAAAIVALDQGDEVTRRAHLVTAERERVAAALRRRGIGVPRSEANFVWLPAGAATDTIATALEQQGVVTRPLGAGVRVSIGSPDDNDRLLAAVDTLDWYAGLLDDWGVAAGPAAVTAGRWLERLDAAVAGLGAHLGRAHPRRTDPVPGEDETWDERQVWAHLAEFGDYWHAQLVDQLDATAADTSDEPNGSGFGGPVPFGRTRRDPERIAAIEHGRRLDPADHHQLVARSAHRLGALLAELSAADWSVVGRHGTLGDMDLEAQLQHFHVGHYEEHLAQLDLIAAPGDAPVRTATSR